MGGKTMRISHLTDRTMISVYGTDATEFLNDLITNDIHKLDIGKYDPEESQRRTLSTLFLNAKGRIMHDAVIAKPFGSDSHEYWVDCHQHSWGGLLKMFRVSDHHAGVQY